MKKSIVSVLLALAMVFSLTTPAFAATKPSTKTITFKAGTNNNESSMDSNTTIKVTNVTSQKTMDFSADVSDEDGNKDTISGKKSKVIYCKGKTTITLKPNKGDTTAQYFGISLYSDAKNAKSIKMKYSYYDFNWETEEVGKKLDKEPDNEDWVLGDGTSCTLTKAGTYVLYVRPFQFYGKEEDGDYELKPVFIVVK
jgi:hypothetical protein